jgi:hypothetical protein
MVLDGLLAKKLVRVFTSYAQKAMQSLWALAL